MLKFKQDKFGFVGFVLTSLLDKQSSMEVPDMKPYNRFNGRMKCFLVLILSISTSALFSGTAAARGGGGHGGGGSHDGGSGEIEIHGGGGRHSGESGEVHGGRHGSIVRNLPNGYSELVVRGNPFFLHDGHFYNRHRDGFIVVRAPIGAIVATLPFGFMNLSVGGISYYVSEDNYFRRIPEGLIVVDSPLR